jgi:hypothetical protein
MTRLAIALLLASSLYAQNKPFSQSWQSGTGSWTASDSMVAGAQVACFANLYTYQKGFKHPQLVAVLITMGLSALYEVYRWAEGKAPLTGNVFYAGLGAVPISIGVKLVWGNGHSSLTVGR